MSAEPAKGEPEPGVAGDEEYERLRLALQLAVPGELLVVQVDSGQERARLPERLAQDGLQRPWIYVDLAEERVLVGTKLEPLPVLRALGGLPQMLRALLQAPGAAPPEVVFLDGLERWLNADAEPEPGDALEQLSLSREALAALPAVVVFLLPGDLVQLLRERALNLWTWRAYDFALATDGAQVKRPEPTLQVWLKSPRGDSL